MKGVGRGNSVSGGEITEHLLLSRSKSVTWFSVVPEINKGFDIEKEAQSVLKDDFTSNGSFKCIQCEIIRDPKKI